MKAERRHDLQENELAKDIGKSVEFIRTHLNKILIAIAAVVLVIAAILYVVNSRRSARQADWSSYQAYVVAAENWMGEDMFSEEPGDAADRARANFRALAEQTDEEAIAAWSYVYIGRLAYAEMLQRLHGDAAAAEALARQATEAYQQAISGYGEEFPSAAAAARIGLGLIASSQRDLAAARQQYQQAVAAGEPFLATIAQRQLDALPGLEEPVEFPASAPARPQADPFMLEGGLPFDVFPAEPAVEAPQPAAAPAPSEPAVPAAPAEPASPLPAGEVPPQDTPALAPAETAPVAP